MRRSVIVYAKRTPIGKFNGALSQTPATELGAALVEHALETTAIKETEVEQILMGQVLTAGCGQAPARQTALKGGLSYQTCATTINRVCGSGLKAVMDADLAIRQGQASVVFSGGQENMSLAPHLLPRSRKGYKFGSVSMLDHMQTDGLWDPYEDIPMGHCGELCVKKYGFTRQAQDDYAAMSYERARHAVESGHFQHEVLPVKVGQGKKKRLLSQDEEPFAVDLSRLTTLRPAFLPEGTITAGNASSISDGAALLVVMEESEAIKRHLKPLARMIQSDSFAQEPTWFTTSPIMSITRALASAELSLSDIDVFEINEAFAVVPMVTIKELGLDHDKVNPYGGAIALGHPIGASGARILVSLIHALHQQQKKYGLASICIGGGEASTMIIERI